MEATLDLKSQQFRFEFSEATVHLEGEFAGNIDVVLSSSPAIRWRDLHPALRLSVAGDAELLDVVGHLQVADRHEMTFLSEFIRESERTPASIRAYWGANQETYLGSLTVVTADPPSGTDAPATHPWDDPVVRRKANIRGCSALIGLALFFAVTITFVFPEVRSVLAHFADSILGSSRSLGGPSAE